MLTDAEPALVVYDEEFAGPILEALRAAPNTRAFTSPAFNALVDTADGALGGWAEMGPDAPMFLLYTSGTTGKPKGAIITRQNAWYQALNFAVCADVKVDSVLLCDAPMFHTVGLMAICWCSLRMGATFALTERFTPALAIERLLDPKIGATHYFGVPQICRALVDDPTYAPEALNRLDGLFLGGAPMPHDLLERMVDDGVLVANGFGMSETGTCMHVPRSLETIRRKFGSVGLPAIAMDARIVDDNGDEVPDGAPGELVLRPGVSLDAEAVAAACKASLASYKRPKHVRFIDAIPRNANGKAQKAQLRALPL